MSKILENFNDINAVKAMSIEELNIFSEEIRSFLIEKVSKTGGHLASNLGGRIDFKFIQCFWFR